MSMTVSAYRIGATGDTQPIDAKTCIEQRPHADGTDWIDIEAFEPDELVEWLKPLGLSALALRCCHDAGSNPRVVPMGNELFLEFSTLTENPELGRVAVSMLCVGNLVLTLHQEPLESLRLEPADIRDMGLEPTMSALVALLLLTQSARLRQTARTIAARVEAIDDRLDHEPDEVGTEEILEQKDALRVLEVVASEQLMCFQPLFEASVKAHVVKDLGGVPRLISAGAQHNRDSVEWLERRLADLWERFDMHQQDKTNRRLATLTLISAVFLPLTLLAGIWGMNFDHMPELHWPYSYAVVLGGMVVLAGGLIWFFYKRGWLD